MLTSMALTVSTYEAKSHFAELLRRVQRGARVVITHRGRPVAELRPIEPESETLETRIDELQAAGILSRPLGVARPLVALAAKPGALRRFIEERE